MVPSSGKILSTFILSATLASEVLRFCLVEPGTRSLLDPTRALSRWKKCLGGPDSCAKATATARLTIVTQQRVMPRKKESGRRRGGGASAHCERQFTASLSNFCVVSAGKPACRP